MGHGHSHAHGHAMGPAGGHAHGGIDTRGALAWTLGLNAAFLLVELGVGFATGSLALLSDAAHMVSDVSALALALGAAQLARLAATPQRSYGWYRAEVLGAFTNGIALIVACAFIFWEALERLTLGGPDVLAWPVALAGAVGLVINLGSAWVLYRSDRDNLNIRGALIHMLADALGSVGAMAAAAGIWLGYPGADAWVSVGIGVIVLWGTWGLLRDSAKVLLQFAPSGLRVAEVEAALRELSGVREVHELHVWSVDGQRAVLSAHLLGEREVDPCALRERAEAMLAERFGVSHTTLQTEREAGCPAAHCPFAVASPAVKPAAEPAEKPTPHDHDHDHHAH